MKSTFSNPFGVALESEGAGYIWAITAFQYRTLENLFGCEHTKDTMLKSEHSCARRASKFASSSRAPIWLPFSSVAIGFTFEHHANLDSSLRAENGHVVSYTYYMWTCNKVSSLKSIITIVQDVPKKKSLICCLWHCYCTLLNIMTAIYSVRVWMHTYIVTSYTIADKSLLNLG